MSKKSGLETFGKGLLGLLTVIGEVIEEADKVKRAREEQMRVKTPEMADKLRYELFQMKKELMTLRSKMSPGLNDYERMEELRNLVRLYENEIGKL